MTADRLIDLSHPIEAGMTTYPGLPVPETHPFLDREASKATYAPGVTFQIDMVTLCGNTGTYVDSPFHRLAEGSDLSGLPLDRLVDVPAVRIDARGLGPAIDAGAFDGVALTGMAVLVWTGHDRHWRTDAYGGPAPFLTRAAAERLVVEGAAIVAIDTINIDDRSDTARPAHSALLTAGIPIAEHLTNLGEVPETGARFTALPAPMVGVGTFPVRAVARLQSAG